MSDVEDCLLYIALAVCVKKKKYKRKIKRKYKRLLMKERRKNIELQRENSRITAEHQSQNGVGDEHQSQNGVGDEHQSQNGVGDEHQSQNDVPAEQQSRNADVAEHQSQTDVPTDHQSQTDDPAIKQEPQNDNPTEQQSQNDVPADPQQSQNGVPPVNQPQRVQVNAVSELHNFMGIDMVIFDELLGLLEPIISKRTADPLSEPMSAKARLYKTLRFLESGEILRKNDYTVVFELTKTDVIVLETCADIIEALKSYMQLPQNPDEWQTVASLFNERWQFPNCLGAITAKHVAIKCPVNDKFAYFNRKMFFSVPLIALVNANHEFMVVEVDTEPRKWDGDAYERSEFGRACLSGDLQIPESSVLPSSVMNLPYVFLSTSAFELNKNLMMPYTKAAPLSETKQIFNYRLTRAHRCAENALGLLASRFGVFHGTIHLSPENVKTVVLACCYLHNYLVRKATEIYMPEGFLDADDTKTGTLRPGAWREGWKELVPLHTGITLKTANAQLVRKLFAEYFMNEGKLPWQNKFIAT